MAEPLEVVGLTQALVRAPSVTGEDAGIAALVTRAAQAAGFVVEPLKACSGTRCVRNLVGHKGRGPYRLAFVGHTDVVPAGDPQAWRHPPFAGVLDGNVLYGRGVVDMKGALAAFLVAAQTWPAERGGIALMLTGDEEEGSPEGMRALAAHLQQHGGLPAMGLIGEASSEGHLGQGLRVGRRGSLHVDVTARGVMGHVAWPHLARNAVHPLVRFLSDVVQHDWGGPESVFPATSVQVTALHVANEASNVVPAYADARMNFRFNRKHSSASLSREMKRMAADTSSDLHVETRISGGPYLCADNALSGAIDRSVAGVLGKAPEHNAGGGVSDGRFLHTLMPVVEFGLVGDTAHAVDERVATSDLRQLVQLYSAIIATYFADR